MAWVQHRGSLCRLSISYSNCNVMTFCTRLRLREVIEHDGGHPIARSARITPARRGVLRIALELRALALHDLARCLIRTPPVLSGWRRCMIALCSGDPTRAICSTLIVQAFQSIGYPILPDIDRKLDEPNCNALPRVVAHSPSQPVRSARLRRVSILRGDQAAWSRTSTIETWHGPMI